MINKNTDQARDAVNGSGGMSRAVVLVMRAIANMYGVLGQPREGVELFEMAKHIFGQSEVNRAMDEVRRTP